MQHNLTPVLLAEVLTAIADAAERIDPCPHCGAEPGRPCTTADGALAELQHKNRLPGDPVLSFAMRAGARVAWLAGVGRGAPNPARIPERQVP